MHMAKFGSRQLINVDMFTDSYRVSGRTLVGAGGIHSELSNPNTDFLELQDAYISRIHQPGEIVTHYNIASFRKDNINFLVLQDRRDGIPMGSQRTRSVFTKGHPIAAFLTVPSFEINGNVLYEGQKMAPREILVASMGKFQHVFEARASASIYPDISYSGDLIMVHKDRIGIFCLDSNKN